MKHFKNGIENLSLYTHDIFIMGDINIDFHNNFTKKLKEYLTQSGLMNLINTPTRFLVNNNSALDHIYYNCNMITRSCVLDGNISDHEMIYVIHEKPKILPLSCQFSGSLYRNYNKDGFVERTVQRTKICMTLRI